MIGRLLSGRRGAAMVEFAMILPVLLSLLLGAAILYALVHVPP